MPQQKSIIMIGAGLDGQIKLREMISPSLMRLRSKDTAEPDST
ncbi:MAG TPA: hypothetical protein PKE64_03320 [Anaerolineae bacterium]|nr:hypothetical protein [Anaerolineae bacterium]